MPPHPSRPVATACPPTSEREDGSDRGDDQQVSVVGPTDRGHDPCRDHQDDQGAEVDPSGGGVPPGALAGGRRDGSGDDARQARGDVDGQNGFHE
jgi:hypothetical protein